ncbi:MAG: M20/M25/M40 family metallo-hydrolase, partial [Gemmatimonadota bacterium]|nr:M20/M25/M40 family metallo-hydrolase [Gemmatimonadota bacterium]
PATRPAAGGASAGPLGPLPDWKVVPLRQRALDSLMRAERSLGTLGVWTPQPYGLLSGYGVQRSDASGRPLDWAIDPSDSLIRLDMTYEHYGQIWRNVRRGVPVSIEAEVRSRVLPGNRQRSNVFAELRGTDKADEYVVIGAHLDSWHVGTGATDNGAGVVIMMEAMRILRASGLQPRRTIRIGLWDPEERGPWGSQRWLAAHPELHSRISAYFNVDNGSGRLRAVRLGSSAQAAPILTELLLPLRDLGVAGVLTDAQRGQSDHQAFEGVGIPAFDFAQDPLDYWQRTHHTSVDTYERLDIEDLKQAAVVIASTAYLIANRDALMPRPAPRSRPK